MSKILLGRIVPNSTYKLTYDPVQSILLRMLKPVRRTSILSIILCIVCNDHKVITVLNDLLYVFWKLE